jgi:hypothetical protein
MPVIAEHLSLQFLSVFFSSLLERHSIGEVRLVVHTDARMVS